MKNKLTLKDCYKYPLANIKEYHRDKVITEYRDILELLRICFCKGILTEREINKALSTCKLVLKDANKIVNSKRVCFNNNIIYLSDINPLIDNLRFDNYDIDGMKESGKAIHERNRKFMKINKESKIKMEELKKTKKN